MEQKKYDIFISYSRKDSEIVLPIVRDLESQGYVVWIDTKGIECSEQFKTKIVRIISNSTVFMFFSSEHSNSSEWTAKEIGIAVARKKPIIPIKLDNTLYNESVEFDLINLDFADYTTDPQKAKEKIQKAVVTHCGVSENQKEQEEHQRQLRLKQAQLQVKYDILREQFSELGKKKEQLLQEMQKAGINIPELASLKEDKDMLHQVTALREKNTTLEEQCRSLQTNIKELNHCIHKQENQLSQMGAVPHKSTWKEIKNGFKVRPVITSIIFSLCFIVGISCMVFLYFHTISKIEDASEYYVYTRSLAKREFPCIIITLIATYGFWEILKMKITGCRLLIVALLLLNIYFLKWSNGLILLSVIPVEFFWLFLLIKKDGVSTWQLMEGDKMMTNLKLVFSTNPKTTNILLLMSCVLSAFIICIDFAESSRFISYIYPIILLFLFNGILRIMLRQKSGFTIIHTIIFTTLLYGYYTNNYFSSIFIAFIYLIVLLSLIPRSKGKHFYSIIMSSDNLQSQQQNAPIYRVLCICVMFWGCTNALCYQIHETAFCKQLFYIIHSSKHITSILEKINESQEYFRINDDYTGRHIIYEIQDADEQPNN